ncbi:hypothetical protein LCGC14_0970130 [marine sediment metagenome]|uniref:Uncharacterized protein n=1 Tax=marine sediment metagenome TaxID=412755 RepID=A0A0F9NBY3_9ZZZZ
MNKLEGFIPIDDEKETCSTLDCKNKVFVSTVFEDKIKGLSVEKLHFWCKKCYIKVSEGRNSKLESKDAK